MHIFSLVFGSYIPVNVLLAGVSVVVRIIRAAKRAYLGCDIGRNNFEEEKLGNNL